MARFFVAEKAIIVHKYILPTLVLVGLVVDFHHGFYLLAYLTGGVNVVASPLSVTPGTRTIASVSAEAKKSGLNGGDTILKVDGSQYFGNAALNRIIQHAHPGDLLEVRASRAPTGPEITALVPLVPRGRLPSDRWYVLVSAFLLVPFACQFLGFVAVWKLPWSPGAWLILAVALAFGNVVRLGTENTDGTLLSTFGLIAGQGFGATLGAWLFLLALWFPERLSYIRQMRWVKWVLAYPLFAAALFRVAARVFSFNDYATASLLQAWLPKVDTLWRWLAVINIALFFAVMLARLFEQSTPDAHRRIRLLFCGTAVAVLPLLTLIIIGRPLDAYPFQVLVPALLATLALPLTLTFVVTVPRAPELGALMREICLRLVHQRGPIILQLGIAVAYLIGMFSSSSHSRGSTFVYTIAFTLTMLVSQRNVIEHVWLWADRRFFAASFESEQQLERLGEGFALSESTSRMLVAVENKLSRALGVAQVHVILDDASDPGGPPDGRLLIGPDSNLSACIIANQPLLIYFDQPNSCVHSFRLAEQAQLKRLQTRVVVPILGKGGLCGIISLGPKRFDAPYSRSELALLRFIASQVNLAVENSTLVSRIASDASEQERIRAEKNAMEKANEAKSAFLASMSHELRTPMTAIIGYTEMLLEQAEDDGNESTTADLKTIHSAGKHLLELINSVLDISKIEAGKMEVYCEAFSIDELVRTVVSLTKPLVQSKNNQLVLKCDANAGYMDSDQIKIRQALFNLISNASKFTQDGTITVSVDQHTHSGEDWVTFGVSDTGIGMTAEQVQKIFRPFSQVDSSIGSKYGGTGLGLSITKTFCEMLSGTISVDSECGRGTTFTMRLPMNGRQTNNLELPEDWDSDEANPLVLVIDDDPTIHQYVSRSLEKREIRVIATSDGEYGLALAKRYRPRAIILDIRMQRLDGWQVLSRLKSDPEVSSIPVLVLTVLENRGAARALGAADYLVKPVDRDRLLNLLSTYCSRVEDHEQQSYVLVVDDDPANRTLLRRIIESCGLGFREAHEGREALSIVAEAKPDLILLDLCMPGMNGFEFMDELSKNPQTADIAVIVVTSKDLSLEERGRLAGRVSHVMERPSDSPEDLIEAVNGQLTRFFAGSKG